MHFYSKTLRKFSKNWPGKRYLGVYRFLPLFFIGGAALEFCMINWHVGEVNFYKTYKQRKVQEIVDEKLRGENL